MPSDATTDDLSTFLRLSNVTRLFHGVSSNPSDPFFLSFQAWTSWPKVVDIMFYSLLSNVVMKSKLKMLELPSDCSVVIFGFLNVVRLHVCTAESRLQTHFLSLHFQFWGKVQKTPVAPAKPQLVGSGQSTEDLPRQRSPALQLEALIKTSGNQAVTCCD